MRRHYFVWAIGVFGIIAAVYGGYNVVFHYSHGNGLSVASLVLLILGIIALVFFLVLYIFGGNGRRKSQPSQNEAEEEYREEVRTAPKEERKPTPPPAPSPEPSSQPRDDTEYAPRRERSSYSYSSYSHSTIYVRQVGYGPVLRIEGGRILDMRRGTYYRIEGNNVTQDGCGIRYEIRGNQIRDVFGSYLYELNGNSINKIFGGFYASISGNYITLYDSSQKYETTESLSQKQMLVVAALLFGGN